MKYKRSRISEKVFEVTGLSLAQYCAEYLHCNNKAFEHRARLKRLYPNEMIFMCWHLKLHAQDLFGAGFLEGMMSQGQPGITDVSQEVIRMYKEDSSLIKFLDLPRDSSKVNLEQLPLKLPEIVKTEITSVQEKEIEPVQEIEDDLFKELKVSR